MKRMVAALTAGLTSITLLVGCHGSGVGASAPADGPNMLRVLASSEVADMKASGVLDELQKATGVEIRLTEAATLDASSDIASGNAAKNHDAAWLSSNRYLSLLDGAQQQVSTSTKIMASPVVLGVKPDVASRLGWSSDKPPTWAEIHRAVADKKLTYAMTNPAASNSGFSALVAVTTGLSGGGTALDDARAKAAEPQLKEFFAGQKITAGSTGWITTKFLDDPDCNALFSYEASLLALNASGTSKLAQPLVIITPSDGVVTADYPLSLLAKAPQAKRELYTKATDWLRTPAAQQLIMDKTYRRPLAGGIKPNATIGDRPVVDMPFPASRQVVDDLLGTYLNKMRRPASTIYVLDVSGSMEGDRLNRLKKAMTALTDNSGTNSFTSFHSRETVTLIPFSARANPPQSYTVPPNDPQPTLDQIRSSVNGLKPESSTALYEAIEAAYREVPSQLAATPDAYVTVVVLTDGEANGTETLSSFTSFYAGLPQNQKVPCFTIRFGDASKKALDSVASTTGGQSFDGTQDLTSAFRTIRGYQ